MCRQVISDRDAHAVIPPRKNAKPWKDKNLGFVERNELLKDISTFGASEMTGTAELPKKTNKGFLQKYCINKKEQVKKKNKKELLVGRDTEINKITEILCRFSKQNVLIIGDHGVGKTALIEGFVQKVLLKQIPDILSGLEIFELDMGALIAGASYKGEIEDRIKNIAQELKSIPKSVLIIEEFHSLFGSHGSDSGIVNLLKSELSNGLTLISTSTIEEYTKKIEKEQGLAGMFELLKLEESSDEIHLRMLKQTLEDYQIHHKITIDDQTMKEAIRLSERYMKEKSLPASAIDLIDHTMSVLKTAGESFLKERNHLITKIIHLEDNTNNYTEDERKMHADWSLKDLIEKTKYLISTADAQEEEKELPKFENADEILKFSRELIEKTEKIAQEKRTHITEFDLGLIISQKTNIPIGKLKEEEKQRQYDEMIELRRQQRKKIQSKGADCTNLKEYQQEVIKIRDFLQITMVILITVLLIWTGLSAEEGERIPILILEFLIDAPLLFFSSKVVTLSKEGCKISYLFFKKMYKWEELEIIREDYFPSFRDRRSRGIVFSKRKKNKAGYIYTTREIVGSGHILECFYIVLDADGNIHLYKRLAAKDGKTKLRKVAVNIPQKLAEWGVEMEKMMKYTGGTYDL